MDREITSRRTQIDADITKLEAQIKALQTARQSLDEKMKDKLAVIEESYKAMWQSMMQK